MNNQYRLFTFVKLLFLISGTLLSCMDKYDYAEHEKLIESFCRCDFSHFTKIDKRGLKKLLNTQAGCLYFTGIYLKRNGLINEAKKVFSYGKEHEREPFKSLCADEFFNLSSSGDKIALLEDMLKRETDPAEKEFISKQIEELMFLAGVRMENSPEVPLFYSMRSMDSELESVFLNTDLLSDAYFDDFYSVTNMRLLVFKKKYAKAWAAAKQVLKSDYILKPPILSDIGKAALYGSKDFAQSALIFENEYLFYEKYSEKGRDDNTGRILNSADVESAKYMFAFYAARLYSKAGKNFFDKAADFFKKAEKAAFSNDDFDNALWYRLDIRRKQNFDLFFEDLCAAARMWKNDYWYEDLVTDTIAVLTRRKDWKRLNLLSETLDKTGLNEAKIRLSYIIARSGMLPEKEVSQIYIKIAENMEHSLYYRALAAAKLGLPYSNGLYRKNNFLRQSGKYNSGQAMEILNGYVKYKLYSLLYSEVVRLYPQIKVDEAEFFARILAEKNFYADSIKLMSFAVNSKDAECSVNHLRLIYPRPWLNLISKYAAEYNIPEYFLYGLIRSESFFKPAVVSHAGAIGLSQLMKPTAADIARRLKISEYDLTDPETNIRFGAFYFSEMCRRMDGKIMPALFSYNAGITVVKRWQQNYINFPQDLFLESLAYQETRSYGRNVLTAAIAYAYLYYGKSYNEILKEVYPEFE